MLDLDTIVLTWGHFFCSTAPQVFFRPDRRMPRPARADDVKAGRAAATGRLGLYIGEHDGMLDASGRMIGLLLVCVLWRGLMGQVHGDVHGSCDDRINLYPAAPFRLATLLHAWMIAREGWGSSFERQVGSANLRC